MISIEYQLCEASELKANGPSKPTLAAE